MFPAVVSIHLSCSYSIGQIVSIATGARHSLLLSEDGRVFSFGDNLCGQCGVPLHSVRFDTPKVRRTLHLNQHLYLCVSIHLNLCTMYICTFSKCLYTSACKDSNWGNQTFSPTNCRRTSTFGCHYKYTVFACPIIQFPFIHHHFSANHQLVLWGHSAHHKLIHTAPTVSLLEERFGVGVGHMGVSVKSGLKDCCPKV